MFFVVLPVIFSRSSDSSHIIPPYKPFVKHFFIGISSRQRPPSTMSSTDLIVSKTSLSVFNPQIAFDVLLGELFDSELCFYLLCLAPLCVLTFRIAQPFSSCSVKATPHNGARRFGEGFWPSRKFWKCGNTFVYFPFSELCGWGKRSAEARSSHLSGVALINYSLIR